MLNIRFEFIVESGVNTTVNHRGQLGYLRAWGMG